MGNHNKLPHGFPMAFTPTSVMIKSSESRNFGQHKMEGGELEHNINLTPSHVGPNHQGPHPGHHPRMQYRTQEVSSGLSILFYYSQLFMFL